MSSKVYPDNQILNASSLQLSNYGMVKTQVIDANSINNFQNDINVSEMAGLTNKDQSNEPYISKREERLISKKVGCFNGLLKSKTKLECEETDRVIIFRLGRFLTNDDCPDGLHGPGTVKYRHDIDTGIERKSKPTFVKLGETLKDLPVQSLLTADMNQINVKSVIVYKIIEPSKYVLNVNNPVFAIGEICSAILRDVTGFNTLDTLKINRKMFKQQMEERLGVVTINWGVKIQRFEISDIEFVKKLNFGFVVNAKDFEKMFNQKVDEKVQERMNEKMNEKLKTPIITEVDEDEPKQ